MLLTDSNRTNSESNNIINNNSKNSSSSSNKNNIRIILSMAGLFHVCQGTCMCASGDGYGRGQGKVLYCYGEVVLQRNSLRKTDAVEDQLAREEFAIQIIQLIAVAVLLVAVLIVLLSIRQGLSKIQGQIRKILSQMSPSPTNTLERKKREKKTANGECPKYYSDDCHSLSLYGNDRARLDSMEVVAEIT